MTFHVLLKKAEVCVAIKKEPYQKKRTYSVLSARRCGEGYENPANEQRLCRALRQGL